MLTSRRRREILRRVAEEGHVEARVLAEDLGVDPSTIRRDLDALARAGQLDRVHGGARSGGRAVPEVPYAIKQHERPAQKASIAAAALDLVSDGMSVILDSGSTTYHVALALRARRGLTVVTNDLRAAKTLATVPELRLLVTGGELLGSVFTLAGPSAEAFLADVRVDLAFLGADAVDAHAGITNTNGLEVPLKRAMLAAASTGVVCADSSKFGHRALVRVASLAEVDLVLTDDELDDEQARACGPVVRRVPVLAADATVPALEVEP